MKLHYIQHVPFESPGYILDYAKKNKWKITSTKLYKKEKFPDINSFDFLVIMGGPMNIYEYKKYPFLKKEKLFIKKSIDKNKKILGICLGAQLLSDVLGGKVFKNKYKEIGWFKVKLTKKGENSFVFKDFKKEFFAFHWHGDTFSLPENSIRLAGSIACKNQAFLYKKNILGLQFHLEVKEENIKNLIKYSKQDILETGKYISSPKKMLKKELIHESNVLMGKLLDNFVYGK